MQITKLDVEQRERINDLKWLHYYLIITEKKNQVCKPAPPQKKKRERRKSQISKIESYWAAQVERIKDDVRIRVEPR